MIRWNVVGLCALFALTLALSVADGAAAHSNGTTVFTCRSVSPGPAGTEGFKDSHCKEATTGANVAYEHIAVGENTTTEYTGTNSATGEAKEVFLLESTQAGIVEQIEVKSLAIHGWLKNEKTFVSGEHYVHGSVDITFEEAVVTKPAGKGCKVKGGGFNSKEGTLTTRGQGDKVKFETVEGSTVLAEFEIESCTVAALNGLYKLEGGFGGVPEGATIKFTHAAVTAEGTLKLRGQKAGVTGSTTFRGKDPVDQELAPLGLTTVTTP